MGNKIFERYLRVLGVDNLIDLCMRYRYDKSLLEIENKDLRKKYESLFRCYRKTSIKDLQDKYRLAEEIDKCKEQLKEKDNELKNFEEHVDSLELQLREQYQLVDKKGEEVNRLKEMMVFENQNHKESFLNLFNKLANDIRELQQQLKLNTKHVCKKIREVSDIDNAFFDSKILEVNKVLIIRLKDFEEIEKKGIGNEEKR